jgi:hypothetical protein
MATPILQRETPATGFAHEGERPARAPSTGEVLTPWLRAQALNVTRHAAALRPFRIDEFGSGAAAPTAGHIQAVNTLLTQLRRSLLRLSTKVTRAAGASVETPSTRLLHDLLRKKERAHDWVRAIEKIWDFYLELFGQRQSQYANMLLSCDRIALDCYRVAYLGLGTAKSIPAPPPFSYMRTGFSPATFRRAIPLSKLGRQLNPFPLIQLPYHRLVNPWTLGAVLHEVSHNLQSDLGLSKAVPQTVASRLLRAGADPFVARTWARWNREMFADMSGLLMGGPGFVDSLMDIVGRGPETVVTYSARVPHPTPYLRLLISVELLRRMGFEKEGARFAKAWKQLYPDPSNGNIPAAIMRTFAKACPIAVDAMCYQPYESLGNKKLADVMAFGAKEQQMIEEASHRLAAGTDPGIIPERFLIGAVRYGVDRKLARPGVMMERFYKALASG